jgi:hypothetical protein
MSPAKRAYRIAMAAYPAPYRRERGSEILATIDDGGSRFRPRELFGLVAGGLRTRGSSASGGSPLGSWALGCQLAALVVFAAAAASNLDSAGWYAWYVRLGMQWPRDIPGVQVFQYGDGYLAGYLLAALIPLIGMAAVCRGGVRMAIAASLAIGVLAAPSLGSPRNVLVAQIGQLAFVLSPAVMLGATRRAPTARARHSRGWLAAPFAAAALYVAGPGGTELLFWASVALLACWVLLGWFDPRYAAAAAALALAVTVRMLPVALASPNVGDYFLLMAVTLGIAATSLHSALRARSA